MNTFDKANVVDYVKYLRENCPHADVYAQQIGKSSSYVIRVDGFTIFDSSELHAFLSGYKSGYAKGRAYR
jgi:hypothetical protein